MKELIEKASKNCLMILVCVLITISGKPSALLEKFDPDWAPSIKLGYGEEVHPKSASYYYSHLQGHLKKHLDSSSKLPLPPPIKSKLIITHLV